MDTAAGDVAAQRRHGPSLLCGLQRPGLGRGSGRLPPAGRVPRSRPRSTGRLLHKGREAIRDFFAEAADDWEGDVSEPQETFDLGDRVLVRVLERWTGRNGIVTEMTGAQLWKLDADGLITSFESFDDLDDARAAADTQT